MDEGAFEGGESGGWGGEGAGLGDGEAEGWHCCDWRFERWVGEWQVEGWWMVMEDEG